MSIKLVPNQVNPNGPFNLIYTGPAKPTAATICTASNSANDPKWSGTVSNVGGTVAMTAPPVAGTYKYTITCNTNGATETASAFLFDGVPVTVPTDCGVSVNGQHVPTVNLLAPDAVVTTATTGVLCVDCSVSQPDNVVDQDTTDYATINLSVNLAASESLTVTDTIKTYPAGSLVGFVAADPAQTLTLILLEGTTVSTFLNGAAADSAGATVSNPLKLDLLQLLANPNQFFVGFTTTQPFNGVQIANNGLVSAIAKTNVYQACVGVPAGSSSSSSSSGGSSSSSSSSSGGSSSSSSSSGGSSSSSGGSVPVGATSLSLSPNPVAPGATFTLGYTTSGGACTAANSGGVTGWNQAVVTNSGDVALTAPTTPGVYSFSLSCGGGTAYATLYVGLPSPIATDCGVLNGSTALPTLGWTDADSSTSTGVTGALCINCMVDQPQNVINQDPLNYAVITTGVGLLSTVQLTVNHDRTFSGTHTVGFIASNPKQLLTVALLQGITVDTLLNGVVQDTAGVSASTPLKLDLLSLLGNPSASFLSFSTGKSFNALRLNDSNLLAALGEVDVYRACVSTP